MIKSLFVTMPDGRIEILPWARLPAEDDVDLLLPFSNDAEGRATFAGEAFSEDPKLGPALTLLWQHADEYALVSSDPIVQAHYVQCRLNGCSESLAEMLALKAFPALNTDATFNRGYCNGNQFEATPGLGDFYRQAAERAGVNTTGKRYISGLAEYPGDPSAWVSGRGDVERVARAKGFTVRGAVNVKSGPRDPIPDVEIAPELIEREVDGIMAMDPGTRREDVAEKVYELRAGKVDPNPLLVAE